MISSVYVSLLYFPKRVLIERSVSLHSIFIVEDDRILNLGLQVSLTEYGYYAEGAYTAKEALEKINATHYDLVILDVNLPDLNGYQLCKKIKALIEIPVVFLTAKDEESDVMKGFDLGADDYITKPFNLNIFFKKIEALLRRCNKQKGKENYYLKGDLLINFDKREVKIKDEIVALTPTEYRILEIFILNRNIVLTKVILLEKLWDQNGNWVDDHTLSVNISRLRNKIDLQDKKYIKTVFGIGYMWSDEE